MAFQQNMCTKEFNKCADRNSTTNNSLGNYRFQKYWSYKGEVCISEVFRSSMCLHVETQNTIYVKGCCILRFLLISGDFQ